MSSHHPQVAPALRHDHVQQVHRVAVAQQVAAAAAGVDGPRKRSLGEVVVADGKEHDAARRLLLRRRCFSWRRCCGCCACSCCIVRHWRLDVTCSLCMQLSLVIDGTNRAKMGVQGRDDDKAI